MEPRTFRAQLLLLYGAGQACCERRTARGKPHGLALVAVMRRLSCLLSTLLREDRLWQAEPPTRQLELAA